MTIRSTSGNSVSVCQTSAGAFPETFFSAAIISRSRFRPGSWITADFICWINLGAPSGDGYTIVFDHRVRQQALAHFFQVRFRLGLVSDVKLDVEHLTLAHGTNPGK